MEQNKGNSNSPSFVSFKLSPRPMIFFPFGILTFEEWKEQVDYSTFRHDVGHFIAQDYHEEYLHQAYGDRATIE